MKIHIYTDIDTLFGKACRIWMDVLLAAGHEVEYIDLDTDESSPLPDVGLSDLNLLVAGIYAMKRFGLHGLPAGRNVLWMLDPLTASPLAEVHGYKAALFDALAAKFDAVIAMDEPIESYLQLHYPALKTFRIPYLVAEKNIHTPLPQAARAQQAIFMGSTSANREHAKQLFTNEEVPAEFVHAGLWGNERERRLGAASVALSIHADSAHTYFDQFRALEAWAAGTAVLSETTAGLTAHGIRPGLHLEMASLEELPAACKSLLADADKRQAMVEAGQSLLRSQFSPQVWRAEMLAALAPG